MGKRLIIKDADFSQVAVRTEKVYNILFNDIDWTQPVYGQDSNPKAKCLYGREIGDYDFAKASGKKIIGLKVNVSKVFNGTAQVGVVRGFGNLAQAGKTISVPNLLDITELQTVEFIHTGVQVVMLDTPIILGSTDWIGIGNLTIPIGSTNIIPQFAHYREHNVCYVNGPQEPDIPNTLEDKTGLAYHQFEAIDYLYEVV